VKRRDFITLLGGAAEMGGTRAHRARPDSVSPNHPLAWVMA